MTAPETGLLALADRNRLYLLRLLLERPFAVGELTHISRLGQSLVSHHLAVLVRSGWVTGERRGRRRIYQVAVAGTPLESLAKWLKRHVTLPASWRLGELAAPAGKVVASGDLEDYLL